MTRDADDSGFLSRWSRRKEAAQRGAPAPEPAAPVVDAGAAPDAVTPDERPEAEVLAALGLPDPDTLGPGADFRAFLATNVPQALRSRALRALWRSDPRLANLDGLVDHGEDFTDKATVKVGMKTAYEVGRGFLRAVTEPAPKPEPQTQTQTQTQTEAEAVSLPPERAEPAPEAPPAGEAPADPVAVNRDAGAAREDEPPVRRTQRMAFVLPDATERSAGSR